MKPTEHSLSTIDLSAWCPHFDHHDPTLTHDNVYQIYEHLRQKCPVACSNRYGCFWVISRYADIVMALMDAVTFSSTEGVHLPRQEGQMKSIPIDYDPPIHTLYQKIFNDALNLRLVRSREPFIHSVIVQLLTPIAAKGGGELVSELAIQLPLRVISGTLKLKAQTISRIRAITERLWTAYGKERDPTLLRELLALCGFEGKFPRQHVSQLLSDSSRLLSKGLPAVSKSWKNQFFVRQCASGSDSTPKTIPTRYWQGWI